MAPTKNYVYLIAEAKCINGTIQLSDEHIAYKWINKKSLSKMEMSEHFIEFQKIFSK